MGHTETHLLVKVRAFFGLSVKKEAKIRLRASVSRPAADKKIKGLPIVGFHYTVSLPLTTASLPCSAFTLTPH